MIHALELTVSEDSSLQQLPADVNSLRTRGGLPLGQEPVHEVLPHKTLLVGGEVVLPILDEVRPITFHSGGRERERGRERKEGGRNERE